MTVTSVAVVTAKFLFGTCDWTVDIDAGTGDFLDKGNQGDVRKLHSLIKMSHNGQEI